MKTQIIQLSQKEDTISVKEKMSWFQTGRILLIWPLHGQVLNRQLDLILVKRYAADLGAELALVTQDHDVRDIAAQLSIPVFDNPKVAQEHNWGTTRTKHTIHQENSFHTDLEKMRNSSKHTNPAWLNHPGIKILCLGISILAIIALVIFILPGARIILTSRTTVQSMTIDMNADPAASVVNYSTGSLPTYNKEVIIEVSEVLSTTGWIAIPEKTSHGILLFTNESSQSVVLPSETVVSTLGSEPVRFATSNTVDVTVGPGKSLELEAVAIKPGKTGNLPPHSLEAIEGELGLSVSVTNLEATTDGKNAYIKSPREQDIQVLHNRLREILGELAVSKLKSGLADQDILIKSSVIINDPIEEIANPDIGEPGDQVELFQRVRVDAQVVSGEMLNSLVIPILDANLTKGFTAIDDSIKITLVSDQTLGADGKIHWKMQVERSIIKDIQANQLASSLRGATKSQALGELSAITPEIDRAEIQLIPSWWPRLPLLAMRIEVEQAGYH